MFVWKIRAKFSENHSLVNPRFKADDLKLSFNESRFKNCLIEWREKLSRDEN